VEDEHPELKKLRARRKFIRAVAAGTTVATLGGIGYVIADRKSQAELAAAQYPDGRKRLPPGQRAVVEKPEGVVETPEVVEPAEPKLIRVNATTKGKPRVPPGQEARDTLKPMGGRPGDPSRSTYRLRVHGAVEEEISFSFEDLLGLQQIEQTCDVHCVTGWSLLGATWLGVRVSEIAKVVKPDKRARFVIFEAAHGYTANIDIEEAMKPNVLVAYEVNNRPLAEAHGSPVRSLVPDRYFWKSAKYLTGIRFQERDERGYWEIRGYHNRADPWKEERYSSQEG
jgi:DMSO/TMAO reductase YedYZ molybdopterin-dependent catalytic subunit